MGHKAPLPSIKRTAGMGRVRTSDLRQGRRAGIPAVGGYQIQWERWPGVTYALPTQCWVGPHHSAVVAGIARAGMDALIDLAGGKTPRGRRTGLLCDNPQVQDAVGRADAILNAGRAYRTAMITELWNTVASGPGDYSRASALAAGWLRPMPATARAQAMDLVYRHGGSTSFKRRGRLAECWRDLHTKLVRPSRSRPSGTRSAAGCISRIDPGPAPAFSSPP